MFDGSFYMTQAGGLFWTRSPGSFRAFVAWITACDS